MGILGAGFSFTRFRITDPVPQTLWTEIPDRLKRFAVMDIDDIPEERSVGWTSIDDMLDTEFKKSAPDKGGYIVFALRIDTRRIPPAILKKQLVIALCDEIGNAAHKDMNDLQHHGSGNFTYRNMDSEGGGHKHGISRERRKELKEQVRMRLMRRFLPIPAIFDVIWNVKNGIIMLGSVRSKVVETFADLFLRCFDVHIEPLAPYALASILLTESELTRVDILEPTEFVRSARRDDR